jgi:integration host factor subunit beta
MYAECIEPNQIANNYRSTHTVTKADLIDALANELQITQHEAQAVIATILNSMTESLVRRVLIEIRGFGSFTVKHYDSYEGRNPKTGEKTLVQQKKLPFFKPGRDLRKRVHEARKRLNENSSTLINLNIDLR